MSWSDKLAKAVYGNPRNPAREDASDMEERRIVRMRFAQNVATAQRDYEKNPSELNRTALRAAIRELNEFDNMT